MPDGEGSTRLLTDTSGNILTRFAYDAYGNALGVSLGVVTPPATRILYTGQQFDPGLQQYYLRARYYSPLSGRFSQRDPLTGAISYPQSLDRYAYVHGDPVNGVDPSGKQESLLGSLVSSVVSGVMRAISFCASLAVRLFSLVRLVLSSLWSALRLLFSPLRGIGRFFWDSRAFDVIRKEYWLRNGPAAGRSLHHWLIPQRWTAIPEGIRNAGFNLLEMPKILPGPLGLNQWMGFAVRWGGTRWVTAMITENGIRVLIPVSGYVTYNVFRWIGNEIGKRVINLDQGATATPVRLDEKDQQVMQDDAANNLIAELNKSE